VPCVVRFVPEDLRLTESFHYLGLCRVRRLRVANTWVYGLMRTDSGVPLWVQLRAVGLSWDAVLARSSIRHDRQLCLHA